MLTRADMKELVPPDQNQPTPAEMVKFLDEEIYGAATWLEMFSEGRNKRPQHDIDIYRRRLRMRKWARYGYARLDEAKRREAL